MTEELKRYESSITKKHSFGFSPEYEEKFHTNLNQTVFFPIVKEIIEALEWHLIYENESLIEAKKSAGGFHWGQKITISYQSGKIKVNSQSLGNQIWDAGRNSKRVKLFIYAFKELEKKYDQETLTELEEKVNKENNWDDYVIPTTLPKPQEQDEPKPWIAIIGGIILSTLVGFLIAYVTFLFNYVIGIYEVGAGFLIGFGFKYLIQFSHETNFKKLNYILIGVVFITYILNQYFLYGLIFSENNLAEIGFIEFIQLRFEEGLTISSIDTGSIGLVISWIFQIVVTYIIAKSQLITNLTQYQLEKVPMEVIDFAIYHFVKEKDEREVRQELSRIGWSKKEDQDDVFVAISAIQQMRELERIE